MIIILRYQISLFSAFEMSIWFGIHSVVCLYQRKQKSELDPVYKYKKQKETHYCNIPGIQEKYNIL